MLVEYKAPSVYRAPIFPAVFLAGSIEMGKAIGWQKTVVDALSDLDVTILNPRRDAWDSSWKQSLDNHEFVEQVEWEHQALHDADIVFFYFQAGTMSPITLMEFGMTVGYRAAPQQLITCCPDGFWRQGNIDVSLRWWGKNPAHRNLDSAVKELHDEVLAINQFQKRIT